MHEEFVKAPISKDNFFINIGDIVYTESGDSITVMGIGDGRLNVFAGNWKWYDSKDLICIKEKTINRKIMDILDEYTAKWNKEIDNILEEEEEIADRICELFNGDNV